MKYKIVNNCPIMINGCSTGRAPIQVNKIKIPKMENNKNLLIG